MAIQDDVTIDFSNQHITYTGRSPFIYSANELYSYLQGTFDEPANMIYSVPMMAQSTTIYKLINGWFMDLASRKAFYGGSIEIMHNDTTRGG